MAIDFQSFVKTLRAGDKPAFSSEARTIEYARSLDAQDELAHLRDQFIIPTKGVTQEEGIGRQYPGASGVSTAATSQHYGSGTANGASQDKDEASIYLVGNSLGAQPKAVRRYVDAQLETWASIGVDGHFTDLDNSPLCSWQDMAGQCAQQLAAVVGAAPEEIVAMNGLTVNLHLLMASFYRPNETRHKILIEWRPFPSDWYAVQSQIAHHNFDPAQSLVEIQPDDASGTCISTEAVLAAIDAHADSAALLLLPGIQYYSGQLFDIPRITAHARARGLIVGWDLAHAAGNVELRLHDWDVDFAAWCTYKYLNAGPGAIAGAFVHERYGRVSYISPAPSNPPSSSKESATAATFWPRLSGWYGNEKSTRFLMEKPLRPTPGAAGFQLSNPSAMDLASLSAALAAFGQTSMRALRDKALLMTAYLEFLLDEIAKEEAAAGRVDPLFCIITPRNPLERGSQLSILLWVDGLLDKVGEALAQAGVVCDKRKPDVVRVAPVPMYCRFEDVWQFVEVFGAAVRS